MAKKSNKKRTFKNGRMRTKLTPLRASLPMQPYEWKSKLPELLLIVGLLEEHNVKDVVAVLNSLEKCVPVASAKEKASGFGGTVSEVAGSLEIASEQKHDDLMPILRRIYCGPNTSLLKIFQVPGKKVICELLGPFSEAKREDVTVHKQKSHY